ncbi:MAG: cytochrome-c oxidase, cbb3-type subunit III [Parasphingorhabdus sp.]|uniref:cytochrome-c oxidase, cbb3-type subunit III n=1 Tax=Parasphingorhabdus sp. TaxID=2709688 RepID=UPI003003A459
MGNKPKIDKATGTKTVGHEWDGIEELDTPMPRWWLMSLYACIIWALVYVVLYPAWPMLNSATEGVLGWSSRGEYQKEVDAREAELEPIRQALVNIDIHKLADNPELLNEAIQGGRSAFKVHCVQCHGAGAAGFKGYPNLNDDEWLWGGDMEAIEYTVTNGIRNPDHAETRFSQMPAFGRDGILQAKEIQDLVSHVRVMSGREKLSGSAKRGAVLFETNCAVCHGSDAKGNRTQGAPNLTDAISLYGLDRAELTDTITNSRYGVMPRWGHRLDAATIRMLTAYVHSLGGGEAAPTMDAPANDEAVTGVKAGSPVDEQS